MRRDDKRAMAASSRCWSWQPPQRGKWRHGRALVMRPGPTLPSASTRSPGAASAAWRPSSVTPVPARGDTDDRRFAHRHSPIADAAVDQAIRDE
jgi:hypothetical protein